MSTQHDRTRDLALTATFAGFIAALGLVPAVSPFGFAVPVTIQSLGVMITGAVLGARRGAAATGLFLLLVAIGLPVLSGGRGGLGVFAGPTVGFLVGFPIAAWVTGAMVYRRGAPYGFWWGLVSVFTGGVAVLYSIGIPVTAWRAGISLEAAVVGSAPFLVGDCVKAVVAAAVAGAVHRAHPGLLPASRRASTRAVTDPTAEHATT